MMRVETVHRPSHLVAGADYRAININRQPPQTQLLDLVVEQLTIDPHQCRKRALREFLQPLHYRPIRRNARQTTQPGEQRIVRYIAQLLKPPRANPPKARLPTIPSSRSRSRRRDCAHGTLGECDG